MASFPIHILSLIFISYEKITATNVIDIIFLVLLLCISMLLLLLWANHVPKLSHEKFSLQFSYCCCCWLLSSYLSQCNLLRIEQMRTPTRRKKIEIFDDNVSTFFFSSSLIFRGQMETSVEEEKKYNPRLTKDIDTFVEIMENLNLPKPKKIGMCTQKRRKMRMMKKRILKKRRNWKINIFFHCDYLFFSLSRYCCTSESRMWPPWYTIRLK